MTSKEIYEEMKKVFVALQPIAINPRISYDDQSVGEKRPRWLNPDPNELRLDMEQNCYYTWQLVDGSMFLFQIQMAGRRTVRRVRYLFLKSPSDKQELDGVDQRFVADCFDDNEVPVWARLDYDSTCVESICHTSCHLHISGDQAVRLPISQVPRPIDFTTTIFRLFYPTYFQGMLTSNSTLNSLFKAKARIITEVQMADMAGFAMHRFPS